MRRYLSLVLVTVLAVLLFLPEAGQVKAVPAVRPGFVALQSQPPSQIGQEIVAMRDQHSKVYLTGAGSYAGDYALCPVHYEDGQGEWQEIDNGWVEAEAPWDWEMTQDSYHTSVLEDFTYGQVLLFESGGESVAFQPMALEWTNDLAQIAQISIPQSVAAQVSNRPVELLPGMTGSVGHILWEDAYGSGRDFEWTNCPGGLNKLLVLDAMPSAPPQYILDGGAPVLRLNFIFDPSSGADIYVDGALWDESSHTQTVNTIEFRQNGEVLWGMMPCRYWDSGNSTGVAITELDKSGNSLYVSVRVPYTWLQSANYPVFIDPSLTVDVGASTDDADERTSFGSVALTNSYIRFNSHTTATSRYAGGVRWTSGSFPSTGDTITAANLSVYVLPGYDDVDCNLYFEMGSSPATFSSTSGDITDRSRTGNHTLWHNIGGLTANTYEDSPDLSDEVQEVIDTYSPSAMVLIGMPTSQYALLRFESYDAGGGHPAKLHIEWTSGGACSPSYLISPSSWNASTVETGSQYATSLTYFNVTNNASGGAVDITISGSNMTGGLNSLHQNYTTGDDDYGLLYGVLWGGQSFTVSSAHIVGGVSLLMSRYGSPGSITVSVRAVDGSSHPTGADLCGGTTDGDTLTTSSSGEWREVVFNSTASLNSSTQYAIVLRAVNGDSSNYVRWRKDTTGAYGSGSDEYSVNSGATWTTVTGKDYLFKEYSTFIWVLSNTATAADMQCGIKAASSNYTIQTSYNSSIDSSGVYFAGQYLAAQTFTPSSTHTISKVNVLLSRSNSPGTLVASIRATSGGAPTGGDLCSGLTDGDTLPAGGGTEWREVIFGSGVSLTASTTYAIVLSAPNATYPSEFGTWIVDTGAGYGGGQMYWYSGSTWYDQSSDGGFYEYSGGFSIVVKPTGDTPYNTLVSALSDNSTQLFGLALFTPTVFDDGYWKTGDITLTVACS